jgi:hypothetical protein
VYTPAGPIFTKPRGAGAHAAFSDSLSVLLADWPRVQRPYTLADIEPYPSRWVLWEASAGQALAARLMQGCALVRQAQFGPFEAALVDDCPGA